MDFLIANTHRNGSTCRIAGRSNIGYGDECLGSGLAKGAKARGKRIAFGNGNRIIWKPPAYEIYRNNPNVAPPGSERDKDIEWIAHYPGDRIYNSYPGGDRWLWKDFTPIPGEIYFDNDEIEFGKQFGSGFIVIEPNVPEEKSVAVNKRWPFERWQIVADQLRKEGHEVVQFRHRGGRALQGVREIKTQTFRKALAVLSHAKLFIGCEGGLHHGAAATALDASGNLLADPKLAVVLFGGFIHPRTTGYDFHSNLFTGAGRKDDKGRDAGCGSLTECGHCKTAMLSISPEAVLAEARKRLALAV